MTIALAPPPLPASQQTMGRMLFWGQQGLSADTAKAVRHYERGAVRLQDPASMYDYAIVLMQVRRLRTAVIQRTYPGICCFCSSVQC